MERDTSADEATLERVGHALRSVEGLRVDGVTDGVVTLSGQVVSESLALTAVELARSVEGVVGVTSDDLVWGAEPPDDLGPASGVESGGL